MEKCDACGCKEFDKGNYCETIIGTINDFWVCKNCGRGGYVEADISKETYNLFYKEKEN